MKKLRKIGFCFFIGINIFLYATKQSNAHCENLEERLKLNSDHTEKDEIELYVTQLESLKNQEHWEKIVLLGEKALKKCLQNGSFDQAFIITDQLVSTYYRLGNFARANDHAKDLMLLAKNLNQPELVVNSLYKFSAAIRGQAGQESNQSLQKELFNKAREFTTEALNICAKDCPAHQFLKAKVLYNAGAAECDDPNGNQLKGIELYQEALNLFIDLQKNDYKHRILIRLGKAYFLLGKVHRSREIIEELKKAPLEIRTDMHMKYLEAQVLWKEALLLAKEGRKVALELQARADSERFNQLIEFLEKEGVP